MLFIIPAILLIGIILGNSFLENVSNKKVSHKIDLYLQVTKYSHLYKIHQDSVGELIKLTAAWKFARLNHEDKLLLISNGITVSDPMCRKRKLNKEIRTSMKVMAALSS
jgi:hypothetical protein